MVVDIVNGVRVNRRDRRNVNTRAVPAPEVTAPVSAPASEADDTTGLTDDEIEADRNAAEARAAIEAEAEESTEAEPETEPEPEPAKKAPAKKAAAKKAAAKRSTK